MAYFNILPFLNVKSSHFNLYTKFRLDILNNSGRVAVHIKIQNFDR